MRWNIVCVGKLKEIYLEQAVDEYRKRMQRFGGLQIMEVPEYPLSKPDDAQIAKTVCEEGKRLIAKLSGAVVVLDRNGDMRSSEQMSHICQQLLSNGAGQISIVIGGSYGLHEDVIKSANQTLSFGHLTYPHQLMRVMAAEQIYRWCMIESGSSYHK